MANTKTVAEYEAENAAMRAEITALKAASAKSITFDIGEKGGILIRGFGRFPFHLYVEHAEALVGAADKADDHGVSSELKKFIVTYRKLLSTKESPKTYPGKSPVTGKERVVKAA